MAADFETAHAEPEQAGPPAEDAEAQAPQPRRPLEGECQRRSRSWWRHRQLVMRRRR